MINSSLHYIFTTSQLLLCAPDGTEQSPSVAMHLKDWGEKNWNHVEIFGTRVQ